MTDGGSSGGGTGSTYDGGGHDATLAHLNAKQLGRVCEADKNPSLLNDVLKMLAASCPPKEVLRLLFTGRTKTEPHRKGTNLTKMLGWGLLDGARISPELSTIKHYAKTHGPAYLGELVADKLIADNLADPEHMVDLQLPELWEAMRGNDWSKIDAYNFILKPMQETGPCGNHMGAVVRITEKSRVWKDALNKQWADWYARFEQRPAGPLNGPDAELLAAYTSFPTAPRHPPLPGLPDDATAVVAPPQASAEYQPIELPVTATGRICSPSMERKSPSVAA